MFYPFLVLGGKYMNIHDINPYIRVAMQSRLPADFSIKPRVIFDYELLYVENGNFLLDYADQTHWCSEGDLLLLRPGVRHAFQNLNTEVSQPHIHFDLTSRVDSGRVYVSFKDLPAMSDEERALIRPDAFESFPLSPFVAFSDREFFRKLFYEIVSTPKNIAPIRKKALLTLLLDRLIQENFSTVFDDKEPENTRIARQVKEFIDSCFERPITLEYLENHFFYNRFYLEKQFKSMFHISIIAYRNQKRMEAAKKLLQGHSVSDVAILVGYGSVYTFSRAFKQHFGFSPKSAIEP